MITAGGGHHTHSDAGLFQAPGATGMPGLTARHAPLSHSASVDRSWRNPDSSAVATGIARGVLSYRSTPVPFERPRRHRESSGSRTMSNRPRTPLLLLLLTACGFPRPADLPDDVPGDAADPGLAVHVSPSGDDGNDGLVSPVKTLKHAIGLAAADPKITKIILASGTYSMASGETYPYVAPSKVTIMGSTGGGSILHGDKTGVALTVRDAALQDLELEDFGVAVDSTGATKLSNIRIRTSAIAIRGQAGSAMTIDGLDITGSAGACGVGVVLNANADLKSTMLATHGLGTVLDSSDDSTSNLIGVNVVGDVACQVAVFKVTSNGTFSLSDGLLDTGYSGISCGASEAAARTQVTLKNVSVRNMKSSVVVCGNATVTMTGGELSHNTVSAVIEVFRAALSLTQVTIEQNSGLAMYAQNMSLKMRDCVVSGNGSGIDVNFSNPAVADLGTAEDPGGNLFLNTGTGLTVEGSDFTLADVSAIGNTWNPNTQGSDRDGHYSPTMVVHGTSPGGTNYVLMGSMINLHL